MLALFICKTAFSGLKSKMAQRPSLLSSRILMWIGDRMNTLKFARRQFVIPFKLFIQNLE